MTSREFELLKVLALRPGRVFSPTRLAEFIWQKSDAHALVNLRVLLIGLKQRIAKSDPYQIENVKGRGYGLLSSE